MTAALDLVNVVGQLRQAHVAHAPEARVVAAQPVLQQRQVLGLQGFEVHRRGRSSGRSATVRAGKSGVHGLAPQRRPGRCRNQQPAQGACGENEAQRREQERRGEAGITYHHAGQPGGGEYAEVLEDVDQAVVAAVVLRPVEANSRASSATVSWYSAQPNSTRPASTSGICSTPCNASPAAPSSSQAVRCCPAW